MADYVQSTGRHFNAALLCGDNFYIRLSSTRDPLWQTMFEQMYDPDRLNFPFYASFGNHDYREKETQIEIDYARQHPESRWKMRGKWYRLDFPSERSPLVTVLMLDSNVPSLTPDEWQEENAWLRWQLSKPRKARWLVCCAHHPLFSNGDHGDNGVLQREWGSLFLQHCVDAYVCGHDHDLQHLEVPGWRETFVLVGGGGASTRPMRIDRRGAFSAATNGFAHLTFTPDKMMVAIVRYDGKVLHRSVRSKDGQIETIQSDPSDQAVPRTARSVTRGGEEPPATSPWSGSGKP
jgi:hypothetical protein